MYLVSVIMPTYNSEKTIRDSINSIIKQTYENWELVITDDCSTDGTVDIVKEYIDKGYNISLYINSVNSGAGFSRNMSIKMSTGRYIAFLDSDDLWLPRKLEKQIKFMQDNNYALTYTAYKKIDVNGDYLSDIHPPLKTNYKKLLFSNIIGCLTAVYDTELVGKRYMPLIRKRQDLGLWLDILKICHSAHCYPEVLGLYRTGGDTLSSNKLKAAGYQWKFYRNVVGLGRIKSFFYFASYATFGLIKYLK